MADIKVQANGNLDLWWVPESGIADPAAPTAAEINAGLRITPAVAWDGTTFPNATDSNDLDDRSLEDLGNAQSRGYEQYEGELNLFYPTNPDDVTSDYALAFQTFRTTRIRGYIVTRVLQRAVAPNTTPATAGDFVSVYRFITDYISDDTEGEDSYKYTVGLLPQGLVEAYTLVATASPVVVTPATATLTVGDVEQIEATLSGKSITQGARWESSAPSVATVSQGGTITANGPGTATITASHPAATGDGTVTVTVA